MEETELCTLRQRQIRQQSANYYQQTVVRERLGSLTNYFAQENLTQMDKPHPSEEGSRLSSLPLVLFQPHISWPCRPHFFQHTDSLVSSRSLLSSPFSSEKGRITGTPHILKLHHTHLCLPFNPQQSCWASLLLCSHTNSKKESLQHLITDSRQDQPTSAPQETFHCHNKPRRLSSSKGNRRHYFSIQRSQGGMRLSSVISQSQAGDLIENEILIPSFNQRKCSYRI